jgi:RNA polymerase sigma-70 factor, ECF subfamily
MEQTHVETATDCELMEDLLHGNADAMETIYQRYQSTLRAVILGVLHEDGETDDVLHDVFLQLWNHADRFIAEKGLHGFLVTLARRRALDRLRRRMAYRRATDRFETQMKAEFQDKVRGQVTKPHNADLVELLRGTIRVLPEPQQEVVELTFFEGMSQREIASRRSIALGTVKTRLQLALKKLLNQLVSIQHKI